MLWEVRFEGGTCRCGLLAAPGIFCGDEYGLPWPNVFCEVCRIKLGACFVPCVMPNVV